MSDSLDIGRVRDFLRGFAEERDWVQYHTPKNLAMAMAAEAGELLEIFQWMTSEESMAIRGSLESQAVGEEIADVLQYLIRLADVLDIDIETALWDKLEANQKRFPAPS